MSFVLARFTFFLCLLLRVSAQTLQVTSVGAAGTGCAPGTVSARVNGADQSVSLFFANFRADTGPSYTYSDARTNCQLTLGVQVPPGYQFAFDQTVLNAAFSVDPKVKVSSSTYYYFQGNLDQSTGSCAVAGPASSGYTSLVNRFSPVIWSPCGKASIVGVNTELRADNGDTNANGHISVRNSTDASFIWRQC